MQWVACIVGWKAGHWMAYDFDMVLMLSYCSMQWVVGIDDVDTSFWVAFSFLTPFEIVL